MKLTNKISYLDKTYDLTYEMNTLENGGIKMSVSKSINSSIVDISEVIVEHITDVFLCSLMKKMCCAAVTPTTFQEVIADELSDVISFK